MPYKPLTPCRSPGCVNLTNHPKGYCDIHLAAAYREDDSRRGTSNERGYDWQWTKVRTAYLNEHPLCERCDRQHRTVAADVVHHKDRDTSHNTDDNLEALCDSCHREEHKGEVFGRG